MFFASLVLAGFVFGCATAVYSVARTRTWCRLALAVLVGLFGLMLVPAGTNSMVASLQVLVLAAIGITCTCFKARPTIFAGLAAAASLLIIVMVGWQGAQSWTGLREQYPLESLAGRLAYEAQGVKAAPPDSSVAAHYASPTLSTAASGPLSEMEERNIFGRRRESLRLVHADFVERFVESAGFGVGRMIRPTPYQIAYGDKRGEIRFRLERGPSLDSSPEAETTSAREAPTLATSIANPLAMLHDEARRDFLDPGGFGYFRDLDHVAGFVPHGFLDGVPDLWTRESRTQRWLTVRVELVSMLKHDRPMVYVSEYLPNMNELREAPVRDLDPFERQALTALLAGDDIASEHDAGRVRALGSLRAGNQCLECHQVKRGALLGAFSYEFVHDPPVRRPRDECGDGDRLL